MTTNLTTLIGFVLSLAAAACTPTNAAPGDLTASTGSASQAVSATVTKIVFVGKENACECTRKSIDDGWAALEKALGTPAKLPVERLQSDTENALVETYRKQKPMVALPAIYFLDGSGAVLGLLQGEVTSQQISVAITAGRTP
jgi:hypothetical protein